MTESNPLLADGALPAFAQIRAEHVVPAIDAILAGYRAGIDALTAPAAPRDFEHVMLACERLGQRLARAWAPVSHLHAVADSPELRAAHEQALEKITAFESELGQNRALYAAVLAVADAPGFAQRPRPERALVEHALRDFRLAGVALEEPARTLPRDRQRAGDTRHRFFQRGAGCHRSLASARHRRARPRRHSRVRSRGAARICARARSGRLPGDAAPAFGAGGADPRR